MNSLNILSSHVTPAGAPNPSRSNSFSALGLAITPEGDGDGRGATAKSSCSTLVLEEKIGRVGTTVDDAPMDEYETTPLIPQKELYGAGTGTGTVQLSEWGSLPRHIAAAVWNSIRWVFHTLAAPGVYLIACLYDRNGNFAPLGQLKSLFVRPPPVHRGKQGKFPVSSFSDEKQSLLRENKNMARRLSTDSDVSADPRPKVRPFFSAASMAGSSYAVSSESESDFDRKVGQRRRGTNDSASRRGTAGSGTGEDERPGSSSGAATSAGGRRSVRIKLNDDTQRQRKQRKEHSASSSTVGQGSSGAGGRGSFGGSSRGDSVTKDISAQLKSPTSPAGALTKYPRTPAPPRPLIPRRQPSFLNLEPLDKSHQKTLILDLDETLIHSMSKGGRMSTGHMVEVRLNTTFVGIGGQPSAGPQHPILYYVHKRPYCDEFLRRVSGPKQLQAPGTSRPL